jgi:hypothetical protein
MAAGAQAGAVSGRRGVFEVDEEAALAERSGRGVMAATAASASRSTACGARSAARARCSRATRRMGWTADPGALAGTAMSG